MLVVSGVSNGAKVDPGRWVLAESWRYTSRYYDLLLCTEYSVYKRQKLLGHIIINYLILEIYQKCTYCKSHLIKL